MKISDRFLKYVSFETTSYEEKDNFPSSTGQIELGQYLADEMRSLGVKGVKHSKYGYVYGYIPSNLPKGESAPVIGFIAHMDTSQSVSGMDVKPRILKYTGGDIKLSEGIKTCVKDFPGLKNYKGQTLIVTDGTTLLGADDKAGIAEIMTAAEYLLEHKEVKHGKIAIAFTPEEETGRGVDHFDLKAFGADFAYTIDGSSLGEIEYESFNAASAKICFNGLNVHPGYAKGIMKNALLMARDFMNLLPAFEDPAHTEGYEGYFHVQSLSGDESRALMSLLVRDHDMAKFKARKKLLIDAAKAVGKRYGKGSVELTLEDSYYNMGEILKKRMDVVEKAKKAMEECSVIPKVVPIRGGTDGCRLSYMGLPCPNLSTGAENFHGINEFVSVDAMEKMVEVIAKISQVR